MADNTRALATSFVNCSFNRQQQRESFRTVASFFIFGTLMYATYSLVIAAAQDILAGTFIQTSMVLVADIGPYFLVTLIAPFFMQNIPYFARITTVFLSGIVGFLMLAFAEQVHWKLIGVGITSFGYGVGEVTFLALTSFYHEMTLSAYSAGTGAGFVMAPLYYTAMTTWACVSPNVTILIMATTLLLIFVSYHAMEKKHLESSPSPPAEEHVRVEYTALENKDDAEDPFTDDENTSTEDGSLSSQEKFMVIRQMLPNLIPIFIAWFSEYMTIQAVITTLAFPNAPFRPRDHYQYYIFVFLGGEVVGRSYLVVLSCIKAEWAERAKLPYLWVLSIVEVAHLLFFLLAAWYRFLPNVWIVLVLSFTGGATIGVFFVNALAFFRERFDDPHKEFAMGYIVVAMGGGTFTAALMGLLIEPFLRGHCMMVLKNEDYCFTRSKARKRIMSHCS
ncbi:uncharacterized protein [Montipora foliosa]|uniref:uncharacterized protein n=1 Tax=Montipora foliosa TaxID=591990 RepID=UPI0035F2014D